MTPEPAIAISRRTIAAGLLSGVCVLSAVVFARRAVGAAQGFTSATAGCALGAVFMSLGVLAVMLLMQRSRRDQASQLAFNSLASIPGLLLGLALVPTQGVVGLSSLLTLFLLVTIGTTWAQSTAPTVLASEELSQTTESLPIGSLVSVSAASPANTESMTDWHAPKQSSEASAVELNEVEPQEDTSLQLGEEGIEQSVPHPSSDPDVTQWMSRAERDGLDLCEGAIKVRFAPRAKQVAIHLPFVPPFACTPSFEAEPLEDAEVEITVTSTHGYGVRLEITRRGQLDDCATASIGYFASTPLRAARAA